MSNSPDLLLVDGSSYLYRAFHAVPPLTNSRGEPTGALFGVLNMLVRYNGPNGAPRIAIVFDATGKTFRDDLFAEYKANRQAMPDELRAQIEPLLTILRAQGLPVLRVEGVEADDVIGTLACGASRAGLRVVISTSDKDMAQLVDGSITLVNTMSNASLDREGVKVKFDVYPEQIVDYLALVGDTSDNIPGIPKVGPKTAAKWLNQYGTLDALIANAERIEGKVGENLRSGLVTLELSRELATIHTDLELPLRLDQLTRSRPDVDALRELYTRYELRTMLRQLEASVGGSPTATEFSGATTSPTAAAFTEAATSPGLAAAPGGTSVANAASARTAASAGASGATGTGSAATADAFALDALAPVPAAPKTKSRAPLPRVADDAVDMASFDVDAAMGLSSAPASPFANVEKRYETITEWSQLERWIDALRAAELFAFDTETNSLDYMRAHIVGVSFCIEPGVAAYVPLGHDYAGAPDQLNREAVLGALKPILEDPERAKVGHHLKYDAHVLENYGIRLAGMRFDTMLESYVWNSVGCRHDMDSAAALYLGLPTIKFEDVAGKGAKQLTFNQVPVDRASEYSAEDADVTMRLHRTLWPMVQSSPQLEKLYQEFEQPLVPVLARMEHVGVLLDREMLKAQSREITGQLHELLQLARQEAGYELNIDSPKRLQQILFEKLRLPVIRRTPTGQPSTAEDVLEELAETFPLPRIALDYRTLAKLKSTYTDKLPEQINERTGRVHTSYHQAVAQTGRLSSSDPNLQNIPIRRPEGRRIRQAFIAPPGHMLLAADYSQIELRIMAHLSGDEGLLAAFAEDRDAHQATAAEIFSVPLESVTSNQRRLAMTINFGLIYGMSSFGLARRIDTDRASAQRYVDLYFARYPGVKRYMDETRHRAREDGFVETVFGRRLYLPDIRSRNKQMQQYAERSAINAPMQGTAADIIKRAMIAVDAWCQREDAPARLIMQVHDELVLEVAENAVTDVASAIRERMIGAAELRVALKVDVGTGKDWDQAH